MRTRSKETFEFLILIEKARAQRVFLHVSALPTGIPYKTLSGRNLRLNVKVTSSINGFELGEYAG